jgi:hypothetical protein
VIPHPSLQRVLTVFTCVTSPFFVIGTHGHICVQMDRSSVIFHGNGDRTIPAVAPAPSDKKHLLSIFI